MLIPFSLALIKLIIENDIQSNCGFAVGISLLQVHCNPLIVSLGEQIHH